MDLFIIRLVFIAVVAAACYYLQPFGLTRLSPWVAAGAGVVIGVVVVWFEAQLRVVSLKRLIGAVIGSTMGILGAYLFSLVLKSTITHPETQRFLQLMVMLLMSYVGLIVGANKGDLLNLAALGGIFGTEKQGRKSFKILDTSVIIDGRIADLIEARFIEGIALVPRFVLIELQQIADSADDIKRARGRRGFEMLNRLQNNPKVEVRIHDGDFPEEKGVDAKLVRLARNLNAKLFTNDFNLAKVAGLQNINCVNLNELGHLMKAAMVPGEIVQLKIVREGRDKGQGIGYLPDGTMVVVNDGQSHVGQTVGAQVVSTVQTGAGVLVFAEIRAEAAK